MALTLPSSFSKHSFKQNWLVQLHNSDSAVVGLAFYHTNVSSVDYYALINNKPSIRESINLKNQTSKTSNVSLTCNNDKISYDNAIVTLSEHLYGTSTKYLNRTVKIYIQPDDEDNINNCLLIYTGKLINISHDLKEVKLSITAQRPWDGIEIPQVKTPRNKYFPVAYGDFTPNASTSNADSTAISVSTSANVDEFRNRKTLYPIPVDTVIGNSVYALSGGWSQSAKAWSHYYEKTLDKFLPLANDASTATTMDSANESYEGGYATIFHKNLLKSTLFKPVAFIGRTGDQFADNSNAINGTIADTSTYTVYDEDDGAINFSDNNIAGTISYSLPQLNGIPTKLQFYLIISGSCDFTKTVGSGELRIEIQNYSYANEDISGYFSFTATTSGATSVTTGSGGVNISSASLITSNDDVSSNFLSSSDGWGADCVLRIKEELHSGTIDGSYALDLRIYDIIIEATTKLDFSTPTTKSESGKFIEDLEYVYSGGDGYPDNGWNSNSAITEIHEAHRDLLHRFTSYTNSNTPVNWSSGTNINSIKDWKCRYWVNEPKPLIDVLEELQYNGQFIFRFNGQNEGTYVYIPDSISTDHTLNTDDLADVNVSLTPMSEIVTTMDIEYEKHPAISGYMSTAEANNSSAVTDLGIGTNENKKTIRLNALTSAPATSPSSNPNDDWYTYVNNIYGEQKIEVSATVVNPSYYGIDVGDFVAFNTMPIKPFGENWSGKDFIVIEVQRTLGKLSCKFREV